MNNFNLIAVFKGKNNSLNFWIDNRKRFIDLNIKDFQVWLSTNSNNKKLNDYFISKARSSKGFKSIKS